MQQADSSVRNLRFGAFEADLRTGELTRSGKRVRLQEQPFQLLALLLEQPGTLVTREQLHLKLWPDTTVDFDHGLNKAVSKIREALGDSAENPRFIETVARRGYRFLAEVTAVGAAQPQIAVAAAAPAEVASGDLAVQQIPDPPRLGETSLPSPGLPPASPPVGRKLRAMSWRVFAVVPLLAIFLSTIFYPWTRAAPAIHSIMVLPLHNLSSDASQEFFTDGMTDELITSLAQIRRLRIVSSALALGSKGTQQPLRDIARELNVDAIVKGTVLLSGDRVRINARLIDVSTGRDVWAQSFEGDVHDTLKLQSQIASDVVAQFRTILNQQERGPLDQAIAANADSGGAYPPWRGLWNGRTGDGSSRPVEHVSRAIALDRDDAQ